MGSGYFVGLLVITISHFFHQQNGYDQSGQLNRESSLYHTLHLLSPIDRTDGNPLSFTSPLVDVFNSSYNFIMVEEAPLTHSPFFNK